MTDKEKAKEIVDYFFAYCEETGWTWKDVCYVSQNACVKAMKWKEEQMIDKAVEWIGINVKNYLLVGVFDNESFMREFKKAMEEINYV